MESTLLTGNRPGEVGKADLWLAAWDRLVAGHPMGQLQQVNAWGEAKAGEGWEHQVWQLREGERLVGGGQILIKATRWGRLAFFNKGPLWEADSSISFTRVMTALVQVQREEGWRALVVQLPDAWTEGTGQELAAFGFQRECLLGIIESTLMIDLTEGWEAVQRGFRRTVRREVRQAGERGLSVSEGGESELGDFFRLMACTCHRQGVRPNPATVQATTALWRALQRGALPRLHFVMHEGRAIAGGLSFHFQGRATFWKKGWDQTRKDLHPNTLLTWDAIRWACEVGAHTFDFVSLDRDLALALKEGRPFPEDVASRRDYFNLGFGGKGWVLPHAMIRWSSPWVGWAYRVGMTDWLRSRIRRVVRRWVAG